MAAVDAVHQIDPAADAARLHASMAKWRRRSHMIHFFRRALPVAMAVLLVALLGWVGFQTLRPRTQQAEDVSVRMVNARFRGRDDRGRAYTLGAREASRDARDFNRVLLKGPALWLEIRPGEQLYVRAERGVYNERTQVIVLEEKVHLEDPDGWIFDTARAVVDSNNDRISGDQRITGAGPMGRIAADSYVIYNQGDRMVFRGNVQTRLERRQGALPPPRPRTTSPP